MSESKHHSSHDAHHGTHDPHARAAPSVDHGHTHEHSHDSHAHTDLPEMTGDGSMPIRGDVLVPMGSMGSGAADAIRARSRAAALNVRDRSAALAEAQRRASSPHSADKLPVVELTRDGHIKPITPSQTSEYVKSGVVFGVLGIGAFLGWAGKKGWKLMDSLLYRVESWGDHGTKGLEKIPLLGLLFKHAKSPEGDGGHGHGKKDHGGHGKKDHGHGGGHGHH